MKPTEIAVRVWAAVSILVFGWALRGEVRTASLAFHKECREKILLKSIGANLPLKILDEIKGAGESVPAILAIITLESSGRPNAKVLDDQKRVVAYGLMGVRPQHATARGYAVDDLANPIVNVRTGIEVLKEIRTRWPREMESICVYNCGDVAWREAIGAKKAPPGETQRQWRDFQRFRDEYREYIDNGTGRD